ncbi:MAG: RNA polymerase factor sigma-54 [Candidatus Omnitrophica bacterium]|nr:RNA polymerase factor sigma-54 [Candidatus Omnitrophota bacterium]
MAQGLYLSQKMMLTQVLAPQLQQSLMLLQAPTLELKALVEQEMQQNPVLEEVPSLEFQSPEQEGGGAEFTDKSPDPTEKPDAADYSTSEKAGAEPVDDFQAEFDRLIQLDQEWREHFSQTNVPLRQNDEAEERRQFMFDSLTTSASLQEELQQQVRLSDLTESQRSIAEMIIGNIDDNGYLQASADELAFATNIPADQITEVLRVIQSFYPPGVGARNLRECLLLQLDRLGLQNTLEYTIVRDHLEALGRRRLPEIARSLGVAVTEVQEAAKRISHLEPRPGREFLPDTHQYVLPEIFVQKVGDEYVVTSNNDYFPHLRISNTYKDLMGQGDSSTEVREYIREKIRAGKFLIKSLHQRQQTILSIAREIVKRQRDFFEHGMTHLKPLTMLQIAEAVGVHETTVSRAVSGKYMQTPRGVFEMRFFFTSGIQTKNGNDMSNKSIKDILSEMIRKEDPTQPLSDDQIVRRLLERGIPIARRTVAKYRSELNILPSTLRKVY